MPRFISARPDTRLLPLPWSTPLAQWPAEHLVALPRGISRHVVRFITVGDAVYAAKEVVEHLALHEYRLLHDLVRDRTPCVEPVAVVTNRVGPDGQPLDPVLLTRHLRFSLPYRSLFSRGIRPDTVTRLIDALVVLLARLHLQGFMWGDVSLSNVLFRRDAGEFAAYLVDAETGEQHARLSDGQREHDLEIARVNLYGELCDLQQGGHLDEGLEPGYMVELINSRYRELWDELTGVEEFAGSEMHRIEGRVRRLNALGFDVAELDIQTSDSGTVRIQPRVVDPGHHSRRLLLLTGLDVEENQARRLLNDLDTFRWRTGQMDVDEAVVAHQWMLQHFELVMRVVPPDLRAKREPAQLFHEVLDYRWYEAEREHREVPLQEAAEGYVRDVLSKLPDEAMSSDAMRLISDTRPLANPYDPSLGYADDPDDGPAPHDPWEDDAADVDVRAAAYLDVTSLRRD